MSRAKNILEKTDKSARNKRDFQKLLKSPSGSFIKEIEKVLKREGYVPTGSDDEKRMMAFFLKLSSAKQNMVLDTLE